MDWFLCLSLFLNPDFWEQKLDDEEEMQKIKQERIEKAKKARKPHWPKKEGENDESITFVSAALPQEEELIEATEV